VCDDLMVSVKPDRSDRHPDFASAGVAGLAVGTLILAALVMPGCDSDGSDEPSTTPVDLNAPVPTDDSDEVEEIEFPDSDD
jgi:hypothetical protein